MRRGPRSVMQEPRVMRSFLGSGTTLVVQTARQPGEAPDLWAARHYERVAKATDATDRQFWLNQAARFRAEHMRKAGAR